MNNVTIHTYRTLETFNDINNTLYITLNLALSLMCRKLTSQISKVFFNCVIQIYDHAML